MTRSGALALAFVATLAAPPVLSAPTANLSTSDAQAFLAHWRLLSAPIGAADAQGAPARCDELTVAMFDLPAIALAVAAQASMALPAARALALQKAARAHIDRVCAAHRADSAGVEIRLLGVRPTEDGGALVTADVTNAAGRSQRVDWRLSRVHGQPLASDVIVGGVSLVSQLSSELARRLALGDGPDRAVAGLGHG